MWNNFQEAQTSPNSIPEGKIRFIPGNHFNRQEYAEEKFKKMHEEDGKISRYLSRILNDDLGTGPYKAQQQQLRSIAFKKKRLSRGKIC